MDAPPSTCVINSGEPFVSFKAEPEYVPKYQWIDDERSNKAFINYCDGEERYLEYVPVFQVMKEYYDEEKRALYRNSSWSTIDDNEYWDYDSETYEPITTDEDVVDPIVSPDHHKLSSLQEKDLESFKISTAELNDDVVDVSSPCGTKFIYT
jgi:hypothetical protein